MNKYMGFLCICSFLSSCHTPQNEKQQEQRTGIASQAGSQANGKLLSAAEAAGLANRQFERYVPKIEESQQGKLDFSEAHTGDFTGDGVPDVAIYFALAPAGGGNAIVAQGLTLYQNTGGDVKVIAGYEPDYLFAFDTIKNGKISVTKLEYAKEDGHCCPSIKTPHTLTIEGTKVY